MRVLAITFALAAVLFLVSGGHLILIPLLFVPAVLVSLNRIRRHLAAASAKLPALRRMTG